MGDGRIIRIGHSPDPDDAFMFWSLFHGDQDHEGYKFEEVVEDIESLNQRALNGELEVTAFSIHAYAKLTHLYGLMDVGASMGDGYGPMVISTTEKTMEDLRGKRVAIPGELTSAHLAFKLYMEDFIPVNTPFDKVMDVVRFGDVEAGIIIHEGQLTYGKEGFVKIADLGELWTGETGLPLPLGGNGIRLDLGEDIIRDVTRIIRRSISRGAEFSEAALCHAIKFGRDLTPTECEQFVGMYVNELTDRYGERGREAVHTFLQRATEKGFIEGPVDVRFV